jgi:hypothetical protein
VKRSPGRPSSPWYFRVEACFGFCVFLIGLDMVYISAGELWACRKSV